MKKIIDEKGRLFGLISIIDVIVVVVVAILGVAIYARFFSESETPVARNDEFTYTLLVRNVREATVNSIHKGDKIYSTANNTEIGVVSDIEVKNAEITIGMADGTYKSTVVDDRYDVIITVDSSGFISEGHYYAARTVEISVNDSLTFFTKYCETTGAVWSIE